MTPTTAILATLAVAAMSTFFGAAHAYGDDADPKTIGKWGAGQAVDPTDEISAASGSAVAQACDGRPHSTGCAATTAVTDGVGLRLDVSAAQATLKVAPAAVAVAYGLVAVVGSLVAAVAGPRG